MTTTTTRRIRLMALATALVVFIAVVWLAVVNHEHRTSYQEAQRLAAAGQTAAAYEIFHGLGDYRDAAAQAQALLDADPALPYRSADKGEIITFGAYEQDNDRANGAEPIQWLVLDRIDDQLLLLSVNCLDSRPYHATPFAAVTWETSDLRAWLNETFLQEAFTPSQQSLIVSTRNENADQSPVGTDGGAETTDRVFALSQTDTVIYMHDAADRDYLGRAPVTDYAATGQVHVDDDGMADWWLRSPGTYEYTAQYVAASGEPSISGAYVDAEYGVRPAVWLDTSAGGAQ
ncbi:DUF6273 domain-containing protein [Actinomyces sp. MRS3W]|uniref:DUF6273 domain-containing protein n=1 Tax=Actinomyces sp. MRS3W TaxID=2800796 RepID=UPI0028FD5A90|nr:DUF6273 domain-containing protein [Actinomyces sp. MRS3W]MDU0349800.1 DUF6273 domain-containing protein [Actinomyces sp. MRS3W]